MYAMDKPPLAADVLYGQPLNRGSCILYILKIFLIFLLKVYFKTVTYRVKQPKKNQKRYILKKYRYYQ